ncbi:MAG TPA: AAA family ATPase [Candidatus Dormibacteraeota bacterium]|jgi:chromosome segregation protein|nr:AAA family ATPase [Candidatus Dormibacteraeota bacterium]
MRLRRVALSGFKTFARRSEVVLEPGITAVVGPNGSGKSNLVDAIRWALGETNARELRGARMDEVIYAGGQGRAPMGMAEVVLTLDNEEGRLPLDEPEVAIQRRVVRSGDSEYRVNGGRVRLRDLERLLGATGLTQSGYAVVAQNDIDGIIQATPQQRRVLIEEAAGVRAVRAAREDTLERVEQVERRLLRMEDLLADAEPRLAELADQAEVALEHRQLAQRLGELRGSLARESWRSARAQLRQARARLTAAVNRAEAAGEAESGFTDRLEEERLNLTEAREAQRTAAHRLETARVDAERQAGEMRRWADREVAGALQRAGAVEEVAEAEAESERSLFQIGELSRTGDELEARLAAMESRLAELRRAHAEVAGDVRESDERLQAGEREAQSAERAHAAATAAVRDQQARAELLDETVARMIAEARAIRERVDELAEHAAAAARAAQRLAAELEQAQAAADAARATAATAREQAMSAEQVAAEARRAAREAEARAAALHGQVEGALGGGAIAAAVERGELQASRLLESFRVLDSADQAAIEAALEGHLAAWVVDDVDAAAALLGAAGMREEVLAAFAGHAAHAFSGQVADIAPRREDDPGAGARTQTEPLEALAAQPGMGIHDGAASTRAAATLPPGIRPAAAAVEAGDRTGGALLHCLQGAWLAPDLQAARATVAAAGGRAVLPDGTVVTAAGIRGGGRPGATIALAAEERDAFAAAAAARIAEAQAATLAAEAQATLADADAHRDAAVAAMQASRQTHAEAQAAAAATATALNAEEQRALALDTEREAREAARTAAREAAEHASLEAERTRQTVEHARAVTEREREQQAERRAALDAAAQALRAHEAGIAEVQPESRDVQRRLAAARQALDAARQRVRLAELRLLTAEADTLAALARGRAAHLASARAGTEVEDAALLVAQAATPLVELEQLVNALEAQRAEVAVAAARAADEQAAAEQEVTGCQARVDELADAVREAEGGAGEDDDAAEWDAAAAEKAEREITRLERRITAMGPVNGLAPEQHSALAEKVGRVRHDRDDLAMACQDLRALADHLAVEVERRFDAVFGAVAYHFRAIFEELFPGGRATLRLEQLADPAPESIDDAADGAAPAQTPPRRRRPSVAGVEILAQPPGKRLQALSLLSGGERALTALAVILALQQVNPSPFYLFDEVDAPLDDANIGRFTRLLRRLATTQQFLVVTHNHATMAAADALYGVTMGRDGTSTLLSVRFENGRPVPDEPQRVAAAV